MATISVKTKLITFECKKLESFNDILKNLQKVDCKNNFVQACSTCMLCKCWNYDGWI